MERKLDNYDRIINESDGVFGTWDYVLFAVMLASSCLIGVYLAYRDSKKENSQTTDEYLLGGRNMAALPVAISLTASFMSSITIIGTPSEFYRYGIMFFWFLVTYMISGILVSFTLLPLFYNLGVTSTYEYLELRFNVWLRRLLTIVYILNTIMYCGIVIYAPALALNQVAGFDMNIAIAVTALVCMFYTTLGGLKAVIWTDVFQYLFMYVGFVAILAYASVPHQFESFTEIWNIAERGGRTKFIEFGVDPRIRHSFWTIVFGGVFGLWGGTYGINQTEVQRYLACRTEATARNAVFINILFIGIINLVAGFVGLTMYAYYEFCDPKSMHWVDRWDQLTPYLTVDILIQFPGVCGLYMASAFAGTLSTVSSGINGCSTVLIQDFVKPFTNFSERVNTIMSKIMAFIFGALIMGFAFLVGLMPSGVLQAAMSINGMVMGPGLGVFSLGAFFPWVNSTGALVGYLCGLGSSIWLYVGSQICPPGPEFTNELLYSTKMCNGSVPSSAPETTKCDTSLEPFYNLSYMYISTLGLFVCLLVGNLVSFITGRQRTEDLSPGVLTPLYSRSCLCKWMPEIVKEKATPPFIRQNIIEKAGHTMRESEKLSRTNQSFSTL